MKLAKSVTMKQGGYHERIVRVLEDGRRVALPAPRGFVWCLKNWNGNGTQPDNWRMTRTESVVSVDGIDYRISGAAGQRCTAKPFVLQDGEEFRTASDVRNERIFER